MLLLVVSALGLGAGCSAQGADGERLGELGQEQIISLCKEGERCVDKVNGFEGICHLNLCCPGCVVERKGAPPECSRRGGTIDTECGQSGTTCSNCNYDPCQRGTCTEKKECELTPVDDGDACINQPGGCYKGSCCQGCLDKEGTCRNGNELTACGFSMGKLFECADCTDSNACTGEICLSGACQWPAVPPSTSCADANKCNGTEGCSGTECRPGTALDCSDPYECTADTCDAADGCKHAPRPGEGCNDGNPCTTGDTCGTGTACEAGQQINCNDGEQCTADACQGGNCVSSPVANDTPCDDQDPCTSDDKCTAGKCKGTSSTGVDCNDNKPCTVDSQVSCNSDQCNHVIAPATTACIADKCHGAGHCSGVDETCVPGALIDCNDNNPCTTDGCEPDIGCTHVNDPAADCSDGDACTENDVCVQGACGGKPKKCLALDACHEPGQCNPTTGACDDPRSPDDKACPGGSCQAGKCILDPTLGLGGEGGGGGAGDGGAGGAVTGEGGANAGAPAGGVPSGPNGQAGEDQAPGQAGEGSTPEEPERPFTRDPGGCSCELPGNSGGRERAVGFAVLGIAMLAFRRGSRLYRRAS
jgi:hypothetical protein